MLSKFLFSVIFMTGFINESLPSQYTLPVSIPVSMPIRFDLPGSYINVKRKHHSPGNVTQINVSGVGHGEEGDDDDDDVFDVTQNENLNYDKTRMWKRKTRHRKLYGDLKREHLNLGEGEKEFISLLEDQKQNKRVSRWYKKRRRHRFKKRGNVTSSGHFPNKFKKKKKSQGNNNTRRVSDENRKSGHTNRKSTAPNRPSSGVPAGGRYRSVDPRQKKVQRHILRFHNILRSHVEPSAADMLAVGWYETAAEQAQAWAEQCGPHTESDHPSVRWTSRYGACGQNVLVAPRKRRWSYVLRRWWSGRRFFRYGDDTNNSSVVSAYTQMAWYNSHQLGCGFAECSTPAGSTFFRYVCNYCPAGNDPRRLSRPYTHGQTCRRCPNSCRPMCSRGQCKLCTNACTYSDLWVNCATLNNKWHEWLCNTKTTQGVERFKNCRATCQCMKRIT